MAISQDGICNNQMGVFFFFRFMFLLDSSPREREQIWVKTSVGIWCSPVRLFAVAFDSTQGPAAA